MHRNVLKHKRRKSKTETAQADKRGLGNHLLIKRKETLLERENVKRTKNIMREEVPSVDNTTG